MGRFNLSYQHTFDGNMGYIIPFGLEEVLPGDVFRGKSSILLRLPALLSPVMHPVEVRVDHFFVPNRLVWDDWEDFITGRNGESDTLPTLTTSATPEPLFNYQGVPLAGGAQTVQALPVRGYNFIYNEYYRDQDLVTEVSLDDVNLKRASWMKDYFTKARPTAQQSTAETIGIGSGTVDGLYINAAGTSGTVYDSDGNSSTINRVPVFAADTNTTPTDGFVAPTVSGAGVDINDMRRAIALQMRKEHRARYGSRYTDLLLSLGIRPRDGRLDRPEYLGGGSRLLNFSEVISTAEGATVSVGDLFGHGMGMLEHRPFRRMMPEHGYVHSMLVVRPRTQYMNGLPRHLFRSTPGDFWSPESEIQGPQEIYNREIHGNHNSPSGIFGYTGRHDEYRQRFGMVSQGIEDNASPWHFARNLAVDAALNSDFINCNPSSRPFVDTDEFTVTAFNQFVAARLVSQTPVV